MQVELCDLEAKATQGDPASKQIQMHYNKNNYSYRFKFSLQMNQNIYEFLVTEI